MWEGLLTDWSQERTDQYDKAILGSDMGLSLGILPASGKTDSYHHTHIIAERVWNRVEGATLEFTARI